MSTTYNALANAIVQEENSQWPNNPGALEDTQGNQLDFGSDEAGFQALVDKLNYDASGASMTYSPSMTLSDFESAYTGGDPNAGNNVASILGVPSSTTLQNLSDQNLSQAGVTSGPSTVPQSSTKSSGFFAGIENWLTASSANIVAVVIGLVLIAGAIWSFSAVRDTVVTVGKRVAKAAA